MDYPEHEKFSHESITSALLSTLEMAIEGSEEVERAHDGWYSGLPYVH